MKKYIPVLLLVVIPLFYSCISRESPDYATVTSGIAANNNGEAWTAELTDTLVNDTMILHAQWKHELFRVKFPVTSSSYTLTANNAQYFNFDNSGKVSRTYNLDLSYPNTISSIVSNTVNPNNKYVTGQFKARFVLDTLANNTDTSGFDTVTLVNGRFTAAYK